MAQDPAARTPATRTRDAFPFNPDRVPLFPVDSQQRALAGLQQDITAGLHLLCLTGPPGSGKTAVLQALRETAPVAVIGLISAPTPGRLLFDTAKALHVDVPGDDESTVRRRLGMRLIASDQRRNRPLLLIDSADRLLPKDLDLLFHFFPRGHASVVLASSDDPTAWLAARVGAAAPQVDRSYALGPLSAAETAGYIRHRLRAASLPEDLCPPDTIATLYAHGEGLPRRINQLCAATLAQTDVRGAGSVTLPATETPAERSGGSAGPGEPGEPAAVDAPAAPPPARRHRPTQRMEPNLPSPEADMRPVHVPEPVPNESQRLLRRLRLWRASAILVSLLLIAVLTATFTGNRDARLGLLDQEALQHALTRLSALLGRGDPGNDATATAASTPGEADTRTADIESAGTHTGAAAADTATTPADHPLDRLPDPSPDPHGSTQTDIVAPPPVAATGDAAAITGDATAAMGSAASPAAPIPVGPAPREPAAADTPHREEGYAETLPQEAASAMETPPRGDPGPESTPKSGATPTPASEPASGQAAAGTGAPAANAVDPDLPPPLSPAQRAELGRLYGERADYEWHNGDLQAAYRSVELGLAADPGNPALLDRRAHLADLLRNE